MRLSSNSFFPQIEPKSLKVLTRGLTQDENSLNKSKSSKLIQSPEVLSQPFRNRQNTLQVEMKKRTSILLGSNQKDMLKSLSEKLDDHQYQIESRNTTIEELERQVQMIKIELQSERVALQVKTEQNVKLQDNNDKLNTRIRGQTQKFDDLQVKFSSLEQDVRTIKEQEKVRIEQWNQKESTYTKKIAELEGKLNNYKEDTKSKAKTALNEAQKQISDFQAQIKLLELTLEKVKTDFSAQEEKIKSLEKDKLTYCSETLELRQRCSYVKEKYENQMTELNNTKDLNKQLSAESDSLKKQNAELLKQQQLLGDIKYQTEMNATEFERKVQQNKRLEADIEGFKRQDKDKVEEIKTLKQYIEKKDQKIIQLTDQLQAEKLTKGTDVKEKEKVLKEVEGLKDQIKTLNETVSQIKSKEQVFKVNVDKLEKGEQEILKSLQCNFCNKFIKEPITVIPCGHSFCFQCKKAYAKDCIKCGPKIKVEAMYRNELLDDIINMYKTMNNVKESLIGLAKMK